MPSNNPLDPTPFFSPGATPAEFLGALEAFVSDVEKDPLNTLNISPTVDKALQTYFEENVDSFEGKDLKLSHRLFVRLPPEHYKAYILPFMKAAKLGTQPYPLLVDLITLIEHDSESYARPYIKHFIRNLVASPNKKALLEDVMKELNLFVAPVEKQLKKTWFAYLARNYKNDTQTPGDKEIEALLVRMLTDPYIVRELQAPGLSNLSHCLKESISLFCLVDKVVPGFAQQYKTENRGMLSIQGGFLASLPPTSNRPTEQKYALNGLQRLFFRFLNTQHKERSTEIRNFYQTYHKEILEPVESQLFFHTQKISFVDLMVKINNLRILDYLRPEHLSSDDENLMAGYVGCQLRFPYSDSVATNPLLNFFRACSLDTQKTLLPELLRLERPEGYPRPLAIKQQETLQILWEQIKLGEAIKVKNPEAVSAQEGGPQFKI